MTTIFVDTNFLLHGKPLKDIPWETRHTRPVTVRIVRTNVREVDKHKDLHPKKHIRERALRALQLIEQSTQQPHLRDGVKLVVDNRVPRLDLDQYELDADSPDDLLIGSILEYRIKHPSESIVLFTHDVGPRLTAQRLGIDARPIPPEDLLPPQRDDAERENERLKRQLHDLQTAAPQLSVTINGEEDLATVTTLSALVGLTNDDISSQAAVERAKLPTFERTAEAAPDTSLKRINGKLVLDLDSVREVDVNAIAPGEYDRYDRACDRYENEYAEYLRALRDMREVRSRTITIEAQLNNSGGKPGEDISVELEFPTGMIVSLEPPVTSESHPSKPMPPRTQQELFADTLSRAARFESFSRPFDPIRNINPYSSGPTVEENVVSWWFQSLKHGFVKPLGKLYLTLEGVLRPFRVTYSIHAANAVTPFTANIVIKPMPRAAENE
jgi:PIN domain-containing protein